ncbi:MAG: phosphatidate cytidylyltransferase [Actinobacteria bacterium]|nr:phosphatidate cytidylyltransferase [Actinomycetota bacterium]
MTAVTPPAEPVREPPSRGPGAPGGAAGRNLPVAIVTGVVAAAAFLVTLAVHPLVFLGFLAVLAVVALLELDVAFRAVGLRPATAVAAVSGMVALLGVHAAGAGAQGLALTVLLLGTAGWTLGLPSGEGPAGRPLASAGATVLMALWVPFGLSFAGLLLARPQGAYLVMATVALTVTNDISAYAFGVRLGRRRLAPAVSPAKTWEGFAGGLATTLAVAVLVTARLAEVGVGTALALAAGVAVAGTVGDLAESLVKRDLGVKDLGRVMPGHGGLMDRGDAILFSLPVAHLLLRALGA